ncbi:MAG TPA: hypothetical protein VGC47_00235 [Acidimicrobiia bacterium]|jgi:peroxiredoxin
MTRFTSPIRPEPLAVGDLAPDWHLRHTFDDSVSLERLCESGPVVLAFYVFDFGEI